MDHKLQPTAAAAVTAAVTAADYVLRPHCNRCQEDNIVVAVILACGILVVIVNCSSALMTMVLCTSTDTRQHRRWQTPAWAGSTIFCHRNDNPLVVWSAARLPRVVRTLPPSCRVVCFPLASPSSQDPIVNLRQFIVNAQFVLFLTTINGI